MKLPSATAILMDDLAARGVRFGLRDGVLTLDAPHGVLTPDVRAAVTARKGTIERLVRSTCEPPPPPLPRPPARPTRACYICGTCRWWRRPDGGWVCSVCHPPPRAQHGDKEETHGR